MRTVFFSFATLLVMTMASFTPKSELTVTSTAFKNNGMIPEKYSCTGQQVSPPLNIANMPAGTKTLALILHDPDAPIRGGFTHWVVFNMDVKSSIPENFKPAFEGLNGKGQAGYTGMCPPSGTHHYHFMVYALDTKLALDKTTTGKAELEKAMEGHILAMGDLVGLYAKK
jgi:Raf kinase inhibitor-like YbhB/YbcL family protein